MSRRTCIASLLFFWAGSHSFALVIKQILPITDVCMIRQQLCRHPAFKTIRFSRFSSSRSGTWKCNGCLHTSYCEFHMQHWTLQLDPISMTKTWFPKTRSDWFTYTFFLFLSCASWYHDQVFLLLLEMQRKLRTGFFCLSDSLSFWVIVIYISTATVRSLRSHWVVMLHSHCYSWWRWWSDSIEWHSWRLWPHSFLFCLFWFWWNWHNSYCQSAAVVEFSLQSPRYASSFYLTKCLLVMGTS
jgi:hypothetical protein